MTKKLIKPLKSSVGRDSSGHISSRYKSKGHKKKYRVISFARKILDLEATVKTIEYDPNRNTFISLIDYEDGRCEYIISIDGINVGDKIIASSEFSDSNLGYCIKMKYINKGATISNIELSPGSGAILARSAGAFATLVDSDDDFATVQLPSGEVRKISSSCYATIGVVSNATFMNKKIGKAGRSRWLGRRPHVRGVAMNPVDHPLGGGEGKTSGGRHPVTPWGKPTKGKKTRKTKPSDSMIISRKKKKN